MALHWGQIESELIQIRALSKQSGSSLESQGRDPANVDVLERGQRSAAEPGEKCFRVSRVLETDTVGSIDATDSFVVDGLASSEERSPFDGVGPDSGTASGPTPSDSVQFRMWRMNDNMTGPGGEEVVVYLVSDFGWQVEETGLGRIEPEAFCERSFAGERGVRGCSLFRRRDSGFCRDDDLDIVSIDLVFSLATVRDV